MMVQPSTGRYKNKKEAPAEMETFPVILDQHKELSSFFVYR
jgi:hypothetical protein